MPLQSISAFLAGGLAASLSHAFVVPIDVVKTRKQLPEYGGMTTMEVTKQTLTEPMALLDGFAATFWGYFAHGNFKFGLFYVFKKQFGLLEAFGAPRVMVLLASGMAAESVASSVLCIFETIRIQQVSRKGGSFFEVAGELYKERLLLRGLPPLLFKMTVYTAMQLTTYEMVTTAIINSAGALSFFDRLQAALLAAVLASLASQPGDTVLSIMAQQGNQKEDAEKGILQVLQDVGPAGSFAGWDARLAMVGVIVVSQMLIYDGVVAFILGGAPK